MKKIRWIILFFIVFMTIILPFIFYGESIEAFSHEVINKVSENKLITSIILAGLLGSDIILPIPSSLIGTACGLFLGLIYGTITSTIGMSICCVIGYQIGKNTHKATSRFVGESEIKKLEKLTQKYGLFTLIITRPIPVLAEATAFFAGTGKMNYPQFITITTISNIGISLVYATAGTLSQTLKYSFIIAFAASIVLPFIAISLGKLFAPGK